MKSRTQGYHPMLALPGLYSTSIQLLSSVFLELQKNMPCYVERHSLTVITIYENKEATISLIEH